MAHGTRPATTGLHTLLANADLLAAVLGLDVCDRVVFALSVLEGHSDQDCALLLGCTRRASLREERMRCCDWQKRMHCGRGLRRPSGLQRSTRI